MRKAGKRRITAALKEFDQWLGGITPRLSAVTVPGATEALREWIFDIRTQIERGDLGICTTALAWSVVRNLKACEDGAFSRVEGDTWHLS